MMIHGKVAAALPIMALTLTGLVMAADADSDRLSQQTGVYNASNTGKTPGFVVDPHGRSGCPITGFWAR